MALSLDEKGQRKDSKKQHHYSIRYDNGIINVHAEVQMTIPNSKKLLRGPENSGIFGFGPPPPLVGGRKRGLLDEIGLDLAVTRSKRDHWYPIVS
jgi:hypothetical protein